MWQKFLRLLPYVVYLYFISFDQVIFGDFLAIHGARLCVSSLMIITVALYKSDGIAMWFGAAVAFLVNTSDAPAAGASMILAALVVIAASRLKNRLNLESLSARMAIVIVGATILEVTQILFAGVGDIGFTIVRYTLPSVAYTTIVGFFLFLVLDGHISVGRFKQLV